MFERQLVGKDQPSVLPCFTASTCGLMVAFTKDASDVAQKKATGEETSEAVFQQTCVHSSAVEELWFCRVLPCLAHRAVAHDLRSTSSVEPTVVSQSLLQTRG